MDVRELTEKEWMTLLGQFNNVAREKVARKYRTQGGLIEPLGVGFFFKDLQRFKQPVPFKWPQGAVSVFRAPVSLVAKELRRLGVAIR